MAGPSLCSATTCHKRLVMSRGACAWKAGKGNVFAAVLYAAGVERLLLHLHRHKVPMAIATSSKPDSYELKTTKHQDLFKVFHHVVCAGGHPGVKRGKPHPDCFLVAASEFDERPTPDKVGLLLVKIYLRFCSALSSLQGFACDALVKQCEPEQPCRAQV